MTKLLPISDWWLSIMHAKVYDMIMTIITYQGILQHLKIALISAYM